MPQADRAAAWFPIRSAAVAMFAVAAVLGPAEAKPVTATKVQHYEVSGSSASGLDAQMSSLGPWHGDGRAYANIVVKPNYNGNLVQGKVCRLQNFKVTASFTMTLPRLAPGTQLPKTLSRQWKSFASFARKHEETHRAIWIECLGKAERRALALRVGDCGALTKEIDRVFESEWQRCERRQEAFDVAERGKLARHPLMVAATRVERTKTKVQVLASSTRRAMRERN